MNHKKNHLTVSIIIVSWNARDYLRKCLSSLSSGVCQYPMEIIVVDNASSDGSPECVASEFPNVRLIRNTENMGFSKANNIGVSVSSGDYLCFVNSDVEVLPDCITRLVNYVEEHPEAGMVGPLIIGGDGQLQRSCRGFPSVWNMFCRALALDTIFKNFRFFTGYSMAHWPQNTLRSVDILTGCFWLVRRQAMEQVGLLDESFFIYGEDMDWCKRFREKGWEVVFFPSAKAIHYGGASSSNAPVRFYIERQKADLQYWKKHHSYIAVLCYLLISCLHMFLRLIGYSCVLLLNPAGQLAKHKVKRSWACLKWIISYKVRHA
ncbi:MAG: glycosyltransferase family 2 protein [Methylomicrobium sp.]